MQVSAINSFNNYSRVNFEGRKLRKAAIGAAVAVPVIAASSCQPIEPIKAEANATAVLYYTPGGCNGCGDRDTVYVSVPEIQKDTIYLPRDFRIPQHIMDSLNFYKGPILGVKVDGDDDIHSYKDKVLLNTYFFDGWDYNYPETLKLNGWRTNEKQAVYDHNAIRSNRDAGIKFINEEVRVTDTKDRVPNTVTVIDENGKEAQRSGLLFDNLDGKRMFMHSNGKDAISVYELKGDKYEFLGKLEPGYLSKDKYGENFLVEGILGEDTEYHGINVGGTVINTRDLQELINQQ